MIEEMISPKASFKLPYYIQLLASAFVEDSSAVDARSTSRWSATSFAVLQFLDLAAHESHCSTPNCSIESS